MLYSYFDNLQQKVISSTTSIFEPSVNIFKNGIIINHQKVGTRFVQEIASGNSYLSSSDNKQVQFILSNTIITKSNGDMLKSVDYHFEKKYIRGPWSEDGRNYLLDTYTEWKDDESFLNSQGYSNYSDFFFNNDKDIYFLIRNPIYRFFSGVIQIISVNQNDITLESFGKLLRENWESVISDIHTINYLEHYKEMIYNIKDKSKIKVIDLSHLKSQKACEFFCKLREDDLPKEIYSNINLSIDSNRETYSKLYKLYENVEIDNSIVIQYLKTEYSYYTELVKSQYFVNLA